MEKNSFDYLYLEVIVAGSAFSDTLHFARKIGATQFLYSPLSVTGAATRMRLLNRVTTKEINQRVVAAVEGSPGWGHSFSPRQ